MIGLIYVTAGLLIGPGEKFPPCDTSIRREPSDLHIIDKDPTLESDTLTQVPIIHVQEQEVLGNMVVSHYYVGKRKKKILHGRYEVVSHEQSSGKVRESGNYLHNKREGRWLKWYVTGEMQGESVYEDDLLEGTNTSYRPNGVIYEQDKRKKGKFDCEDGFARVFHNNGRIKLDLVVKDGVIVKNDLYDTLGLPTVQKAIQVR